MPEERGTVLETASGLIKINKSSKLTNKYVEE
jgi:hypothetical protein